MAATENTLVTKEKWAAFLQILGDTPTYERMGEGFTELSESKNPKEYSRTYKHENFERTDVVGYSPSISYSFDAYTNDPCTKELAKIADGEYTGNLAQRKVCTVNLWEEDETTPGTYVAYERTYAIIPDSKGDGEEAVTYSGTMKCVSEKVKGKFNLALKTFTPDE